MKYYRDIEAGETLQAGDERLSSNAHEWVPVEAVWIGQRAPTDLAAWYRRSVDAVSREEYEMLARAIGRADQQAADQAALVATLQSQPRLQRVTPWAVADLEQREAAGVLFVYGYHLQIASYNSSRGWWWSGSIGGQVGRPSRGWFVELNTLKEVQQ